LRKRRWIYYSSIMTYSVPGYLAYRHYGPTTIVINNRIKTAVFLRDVGQRVWRRLLDRKEWQPEDLPILQRLGKLGLVDSAHSEAAPADLATHKSCDVPPSGAISLWSFRNNIPLSGHFELTGRCNLRCLHCYCTFSEKQDALSTHDVFRIIDDLHDAGTLGLVLTGGEIFVRRDIGDILTYLQERRFIIRINTNATLLKPPILRLVADLTNVYRIHVSLYSANAAVHDAVTKVKGSFEKTLSNLEALKDAGHDVRINCSVLRTNAASYQEVRTTIGDGLGIPVRFDPFIFPKDDGSSDNLVEFIGRATLAEFDMFNGRRDLSEPKKAKLCKAAFSFFAIDSTGNVYPCLKMKKSMASPLGKVPQQRFGDVWRFSEQVKEIRKVLDNRLRKCSICELEI